MKSPARGRHCVAMSAEERLLEERVIALIPMIATFLLRLCASHHKDRTPGFSHM